MMWPRVRLLRETLAPHHSWMTIDDNEIHNARALLDGIFGEDKFVACCVWQKHSQPEGETIGDVHDYVIVYSKAPGAFDTRKNKISPTEDGLVCTPIQTTILKAGGAEFQ